MQRVSLPIDRQVIPNGTDIAYVFISIFPDTERDLMNFCIFVRRSNILLSKNVDYIDGCHNIDLLLM